MSSKEAAKFDANNIQNNAEEVVSQILAFTFQNDNVERIKDSNSTDIKISNAAGKIRAYCEVSTDSDLLESRLDSALAKIGNFIPSEDLKYTWMMSVEAIYTDIGKPINTVNDVLSLENSGVTDISADVNLNNKNLIMKLLNKGIISARVIQKSNSGNGIFLLKNSHVSPIARESEEIDKWIHESLTGEQFLKKQNKILNLPAEELHLALVINNKTPAQIRNLQLVDGRFGVTTPQKKPPLMDHISDLWIVYSWFNGWWHWNKKLNVWRAFAGETNRLNRNPECRKIVFCKD